MKNSHKMLLLIGVLLAGTHVQARVQQVRTQQMRVHNVSTQAATIDARTQALLDQARQALGGSNLSAVNGLAIDGNVQHLDNNSTQKIKMIFFSKIDNQAIDTKEMQFQSSDGQAHNLMVIQRHDGPGVSSASGNGNVEFGTQATGLPTPPPGQKMIIRRQTSDNGQIQQDVEINGSVDGLPAPPPMVGRIDAMLFADLLKTDDMAELTYGGQADNEHADIINFRSNQGLTGQLYLDQTSHLPILINYVDNSPAMVFVREDGNQQKVTKDVTVMTAAPTDAVNVQLRFSDQRSVDGVLLPFHISKSVNNQLVEEWQIDSYQINPKPDSMVIVKP